MTKSLTEQQTRKIIENGTGKAAKVCKEKFYGKPKSLTEQWKDGELPCGAYYVNRLGETRIYLVKYEDGKNTHEIYEILAPVPSYDEWKHTKEKLKKATELNCNHAYKTNKRRIQINNLKNENNQLREQLKEKNVKLNELRHKRNETIEKLEQQLAIATTALERYSKDDYYSEGGGRSVNPYPDIARKALKEMEGVK